MIEYISVSQFHRYIGLSFFAVSVPKIGDGDGEGEESFSKFSQEFQLECLAIGVDKRSLGKKLSKLVKA